MWRGVQCPFPNKDKAKPKGPIIGVSMGWVCSGLGLTKNQLDLITLQDGKPPLIMKNNGSSRIGFEWMTVEFNFNWKTEFKDKTWYIEDHIYKPKHQ